MHRLFESFLLFIVAAFPIAAHSSGISAFSCQSERESTFLLVDLETNEEHLVLIADDQSLLLDSDEMIDDDVTAGTIRLIHIATSTMLILHEVGDRLEFIGLLNGRSVEGTCFSISEVFSAALRFSEPHLDGLLTEKELEISRQRSLAAASNDEILALKAEIRETKDRLLAISAQLSQTNAAISAGQGDRERARDLTSEHILFERLIVTTRSMFVAHDDIPTEVRQAYNRMYFYVIENMGRQFNHEIQPIPMD